MPVVLLNNPLKKKMRREFLHSRRARLSPEDVGLVSTGRRGTPGLRREEVAALAGVSASWYTWLEQGRDIKVSDAVLDAVSHALRLTPAERAHLYRLTGRNPPHSAAAGRRYPALGRLTDDWHLGPAYVLDRHWTVVAANTEACDALGVRVNRNRLAEFFTDPAFAERHPRWRETAELLLGEFRVRKARFPDDEETAALVHELTTASTVFHELWRGQRIADGADAVVEIRREDGTHVRLRRVMLGTDDHGECHLVVYTPVDA
ncbi:helix-turn-helix transcriptional regulator [Nocardia sp. NRRL S-836]|uniref:helix-turn-helix transcriptional regulator n=1 Tax=Nocardia sp. NRRL S-836 TaxID=1519492 RepID=UPI0006AEB239|nr:helix-turn-helix transcriptional regulator [Nocardia sp. NRRL S-836]